MFVPGMAGKKLEKVWVIDKVFITKKLEKHKKINKYNFDHIFSIYPGHLIALLIAFHVILLWESAI